MPHPKADEDVETFKAAVLEVKGGSPTGGVDDIWITQVCEGAHVVMSPEAFNVLARIAGARRGYQT